MSPTPSARSRRWKLIVCAIIAIAAGLRGSGITAGAPYRMGVDEPIVLSTALHMMKTGDFNPHFYDYGGLTLYLQMAVASIRFLSGAMAREWASLDQVWEGDFLVAGRLVSVVLGSATVWLVYLAALRWGATAAVIAVCAMAVQPQHVRESHFALTDTPLTFLVTLTLWLSLKASENGRAGTFVLAGLAAGAAAATKYHGILAIVMPIAATVSLPQARTSATAIAAAMAGGVAGFLIGAPYSIIDLPGFLNGFASLMQHYNAPRAATSAAIVYVKYMRGWFAAPPAIPVTFGWIGIGLCAIGLAGVLWQVRERATRAAALVLTTFPLVFLWFISNQGALQYGRYALPLAPMLSIFLAVAIVDLRARLLRDPNPPRRIAAASLFLVLLPPLGSSVYRNIVDQRVTTSDQLAIWLVRNVRPDEPIVITDDLLRLPPTYKVENANRLIERSIEQYRKDGVAYLIASSAESGAYLADASRRGGQTAAFMAIMSGTEMVQTFPQTPTHPGPTITVLKVPK